MKTIHEEYIRLTGEENVPKVMVLDSPAHKEAMDAHVEEHFDISVPITNGTIEEFLDIHKTTEGLECEVLVRDNKKGIYFELKGINDSEVREALRVLPIGGEMHLHLMGKDRKELARQLTAYVATRTAEPIKKIYEIGEKYRQDGHQYVNIMIKNEHGLHIRPAALFAAEANKYKADIYAIKDENEVSAKSIMGIMTLAAEKGSIITLKAKGENAEKALDGLYELCNNGFCEYKTKTGTSLL